MAPLLVANTIKALHCLIARHFRERQRHDYFTSFVLLGPWVMVPQLACLVAKLDEIYSNRQRDSFTVLNTNLTLRPRLRP